jgi:lysophospholipase L1-like esterase
MKKYLFFIFLPLFGILSGCKNTPTNARIMLIGDSWAQLMCIDGSFSDALSELGFQYTDINCDTTTRVGTTAEYWTNSGRLKIIETSMSLSKNLETIYISLGGNDIIGYWNKNMTTDEENKNAAIVQSQLLQLIDFIQSKKPNVQIVLSSYDYLNFQYFMAHQQVPGYVDIYNRMGQPTDQELNLANGRFEQIKVEITKLRKNVKYVNNNGLLQYFYGQSQFGVPAQSTQLPGQAPEFTPFLGGRPDLPGPSDAFLAVPLINFTDPYHLNAGAYKVIAHHILSVIGY